MQSFTGRRRRRPGAPLAIGFGLLTVCACADRTAAIPAAAANRSFHQVASGVDVLVTANRVFEP